MILNLGCATNNIYFIIYERGDNMKFKDKISNLRKKNNLSQEALAEKLNMSRQAISKWESGNSYPDMNTMIKICEVLNCTIDELLDDNAIGNNNFEKQNKININKWIKELLDFITKLYNMFFSMKFKEKIKFIIEMSFILGIILLIFMLAYFLLDDTIFSIFYYLPYYLYNIIIKSLNIIYSIFSIGLGGIIFIHLLKIRYLDYYITIEDSTIEDKIIEKELEEKQNNKKEYKYIEQKKEKIIIRDPKHSTYSFFSGIGKILLFLLKIFIVILLIPFIISFILLCFGSTISLIWFKYGIIFIGLFIACIGLLLINYDFLEICIKFIFNKLDNFKKLFIVFISGLFIFGIGCGISFSEISKFTITDNKYFYENKNIYLTMDNSIILQDFNPNIVVIDNNQKDIIFNVSYTKNIEVYINNYYDNYYIVDYDFSRFNLVNVILNDIKNKKIRDYDDNLYKINKIIMSEENYKIISNNYNEYFGY